MNLDTTIPLFKAFQALYLHLKSPQWRSAPFKRAKRDLLLATKEALKDLDQQTSKSMMDKITKGDVRFQDHLLDLDPNIEGDVRFQDPNPPPC